jgi:hypothetical protein
MGLLRVRPRIDTTDSSLQAFARYVGLDFGIVLHSFSDTFPLNRLSLPQDNDRLMERLISLLPEDPDEPWNKMSDQYKSTLWDIFPDVQVCGIGENDTVIVDGFRGAMVQWSKFSTVQTTKRMSWKLKTLIYITLFTPLIFLFGLFLLALPSRTASIILLVLSSTVICLAPVYVPHLYKGKLYEVEPCLFGIEGYIPLPDIEEVMFGARMGRLKWSPYGSLLSRHRYREKFREHVLEDIEAGAQQPMLNTHDPVFGYPVEAVDPCSACDNCITSPPTSPCTHLRYSSAEEMSKSDYGSMKVRFLQLSKIYLTLFGSNQFAAIYPH